MLFGKEGPGFAAGGGESGGGGSTALTQHYPELVFSGLSRRGEGEGEVEAACLPAVHFLEPEEPEKRPHIERCKQCS